MTHAFFNWEFVPLHLFHLFLASSHSHFFFTQNNIPLPRCTTVYLPFPLPKSWLFLSFGNYEQSCCKHPCVGFCVDMFSNPLGEYQSVQLLDPMVKSLLSFVRNPQSSRMTVPFSAPTSTGRTFLLPHILTRIWLAVGVLDIGCSNRFLVVSHYCFTHFPGGT